MTTKFEIFWHILSQQMDFSGEEEEATKKIFLESMEKAGLTSNIEPMIQYAPVVSGTHKHLSGWNLYVKDRMPTFKGHDMSGSECMTAIGAEWKDLTKEQQGVWNMQAKSVGTSTLDKKPRQVSGWTMYMKQRMADLKEEVKSSSERLKIIGPEWKLLSKEQQDEWKLEAKGIPSGESLPVSTGQKRRLSGWNLYVKQRMADLKEEVKSSSERLKIIGPEWKLLSKEQQDEWNLKAK